MYNSDGVDNFDFIEIYNNDISTLDISGWTFSSGVTFTFPGSTSIAPGEYIVITMDAVEIDDIFGVPAYEWASGGLPNSGETITLETAIGNLVDEVTYATGGDWPGEANGTGPSLELCELYYDDNNDGNNWQASTEFVTDTYDDGGDPEPETIYATPQNVRKKYLMYMQIV
jgi:hypothetical protein